MDASFENLIEVRPGGRDSFGGLTGKHSRGGKASALAERQTRNARLIEALAANPGLSARVSPRCRRRSQATASA